MVRTIRLQAYSRGRVVEVYVPSYTPMKKGDPIVQIDPEPFEIIVRQKQAALAAAIIGNTSPGIRQALEQFRAERRDTVLASPDPSRA